MFKANQAAGLFCRSDIYAVPLDMAIAKQDVPHTIRFVTGRSPPPIATVDVQKFLPIPIESEVAMAEEDIPGNGTLQGAALRSTTFSSHAIGYL